MTAAVTAFLLRLAGVKLGRTLPPLEGLYARHEFFWAADQVEGVDPWIGFFERNFGGARGSRGGG